MGAENNFDMDEGTLEIGMGKIIKYLQFFYIFYNEKIDRKVAIIHNNTYNHVCGLKLYYSELLNFVYTQNIGQFLVLLDRWLS